MVKLVMRKRAAQHAGELGLFVDFEPFAEDFSAIKLDAEVEVDAKTKRSLKQHKFIWALATKVAEACDFLETKDDAYTYMLIEAKHARYIYDHHRQISYAVPKATNWGAMDGSAFTKLAKRITHIVGTHIVPGIDNELLRAEIEKMLAPDLIPTDMGPEPPPIDTIPDGPGIGHNSGPAGVTNLREDAPGPVSDQREQVSDPPDRPAAGGQPANAPATDDRAPEQRASPEPPVARETASRDVPQSGTSAIDWSKPPENGQMYPLYARHHIKRAASPDAAREWLNSAEQWQLRANLKVPIGVRKVLERECVEIHGGKL